MEPHEKTHHHIKKAQMLIVVAIAINIAFFLWMYSAITTEIGALNSRIGVVNTNLQMLDLRASEGFESIGSNITILSGGLDENAQSIGILAMLMGDLNDEITRVGNESHSEILGLRSELNYTGTIDKALDAVVLIVWTDKATVVGSGFLVSADGYVMTANHVVDAFDGRTVRVKTKEGDIYIASVAEQDVDSDVAVLKIDVGDMPYLEFADSDSLPPGSKVFALGAPQGFAFSATEGIVSAVRSVRSIKEEVGLELDLGQSVKVVQTDAAITSGNSGGPLIDSTGGVVGVNSFGISKDEGFIYLDIAGLNFAIASNDAVEVYGRI